MSVPILELSINSMANVYRLSRAIVQVIIAQCLVLPLSPGARGSGSHCAAATMVSDECTFFFFPDLDVP